MNDDIQFSRRERLIYYLSDIVTREVAEKIYFKLDYLADRVLMTLDEEIYEEFLYQGIIKE